MKTIHIFTILCLFSTLTMSTTCDGDVFSNVIIANQSDEPIYVYALETPSDEICTIYSHFQRDETIHKLGKNETFKDIVDTERMEEGIDRYQVLILKQSTMIRYSKEEIIEKRTFDKRYILTWKDLQSMRFNITYTGKR